MNGYKLLIELAGYSLVVMFFVAMFLSLWVGVHDADIIQFLGRKG